MEKHGPKPQNLRSNWWFKSLDPAISVPKLTPNPKRQLQAHALSRLPQSLQVRGLQSLAQSPQASPRPKPQAPARHPEKRDAWVNSSRTRKLRSLPRSGSLLLCVYADACVWLCIFVLSLVVLAKCHVCCQPGNCHSRCRAIHSTTRPVPAAK